MFLTRAQIRKLTGLPSTEAEAQVRFLNERGIRNFGINAAGQVVVPCSAIDAPQRPATEQSGWAPDMSVVP